MKSCQVIYFRVATIGQLCTPMTYISYAASTLTMCISLDLTVSGKGTYGN